MDRKDMSLKDMHNDMSALDKADIQDMDNKLQAEEEELDGDKELHIEQLSDTRQEQPADSGNDLVAADALFTEEPAAIQAGYFRIFGLSSLLYAIVYTICMFHNISGVTMPVWIAATILYACVTMKQMHTGTVMKQVRADASVQPSASASANQRNNSSLADKVPIRIVSEQSAEDLHMSDSQISVTADKKLRANSWFYIAVMLLLGTATFLTDQVSIICLNYFGFFVMLILFLLHNIYDDSQWDFSKSLTEITVAVFGAIGCMFVPFTDGYAFCQEKKVRKSKTMRAVLIGLLLAVPALLVLGFCLMCADAVFDTMVMHLFSGLRMPVKGMEVAGMLLFGYFSSYCGMRYLSLRSRTAVRTHKISFDPVIAMTFAGLLLVMYLVFCGVQVLYLFAGNMQLPEGMTYADYAHRGFYMLLFVCLVNLMLVLFMRKYFARHQILDVMLLLICVCTFVMMASSAYRMFLYIAAYQLTFLRVLVLAALVALALLMAGVVLMILKPQFPLFRYSLVVVSVIYLCLAFSHVDGMIASYNLSHARETNHIDWWYLSQLSTDAAPVVMDYYADASREVQKQMELCALQAKHVSEGSVTANNLYMGHDSVDGDNWFAIYMYKVLQAEKSMGLRNFNVSRYRAVKLLHSGIKLLEYPIVYEQNISEAEGLM